MKKITLTLALFIAGLSVSMAQTATGSEPASKKEVNTSKEVKPTNVKPQLKVKPVKKAELKAVPRVKSEAVIEEKKTNQK